MAKKVCCVHCGSTSFIKKGSTRNARKFLCKNCKRSFQISAEDLKGTAYEMEIADITSSETNKKTNNIDTNKVKKPVSTNTTSKKTSEAPKTIIDKTIKNNNVENTDINFDEVNDIDLGKVKKDKNGNYLMRIGNKPPMPIGTTKNDLLSIIRKHGGSCTLSLGSDGIFILNVATTTKG